MKTYQIPIIASSTALQTIQLTGFTDNIEVCTDGQSNYITFNLNEVGESTIYSDELELFTSSSLNEPIIDLEISQGQETDGLSIDGNNRFPYYVDVRIYNDDDNNSQPDNDALPYTVWPTFTLNYDHTKLRLLSGVKYSTSTNFHENQLDGQDFIDNGNGEITLLVEEGNNNDVFNLYSSRRTRFYFEVLDVDINAGDVSINMSEGEIQCLGNPFITSSKILENTDFNAQITNADLFASFNQRVRRDLNCDIGCNSTTSYSGNLYFEANSTYTGFDGEVPTIILTVLPGKAELGTLYNNRNANNHGWDVSYSVVGSNDRISLPSTTNSITLSTLADADLIEKIYIDNYEADGSSFFNRDFRLSYFLEDNITCLLYTSPSPRDA